MIYLHSGMAGAPQVSQTKRSFPDVLSACLVSGFNTQAPTTATASGGVLTLNYGSAHGYDLLTTLQISGANVSGANGQFSVATVPAGNQLTVSIPSLPDGPVGGTMSTKVASLGWTEPFAAGTTDRAFKMASGNQRFLWCQQDEAMGGLRFRGWEDMSALNTGTGPFPTTAQRANGLGENHGGLNGYSWAVFGQGNFVYMCLTPSSGSAFFSTFFGDLAEPVVPDDNYSTFLGHISSSSSYQLGYLPRDHSGFGSAVESYAISMSGLMSLTVPSPVNSATRFLFGVPVLQGSSVLRGLLPGAFSALPRTPANTTLTGVLGVSGRMRSVPSFMINESMMAVAIEEDF